MDDTLAGSKHRNTALRLSSALEKPSGAKGTENSALTGVKDHVDPTDARGDAFELIKLMTKLDEETKFMMLEPGERQTTLEAQEQTIESLGDLPQGHASCGGHEQLVGFVSALANGEPQQTLYVLRDRNRVSSRRYGSWKRANG